MGSETVIASYYFDARATTKRKWVAAKPRKNIVERGTFHTEEQARRFCGLEGGNTIPQWEPDTLPYGDAVTA